MSRGLFGAIASDASTLEDMLARIAPERRAAVGRISGAGFVSAFLPVPGPASVAFDGALHDCAGPAGDRLRQAYAGERAGCFARLDGNFAACLSDPELPGFAIGGDAARTRPIYYVAADGGIVFGSHALEVQAASGRRPVAHPPALARFLLEARVGGEEETLFAGVRELPAGACLEMLQGRPVRVLSLPEPLDERPGAPQSLEDRARAFRDLLLGVVAGFSDGRRTGLALSGGIDSAGLGAALRASRASGESIAAFCFVHDPAELPASVDERPWAQRAAEHLQAALREVRLATAAVPGVLRRVARAQDFPLGSPVVLAQSEVFRIAAEEGVETLLSGHGPDYLLGGGDSHVRERAIGLLRTGRLAQAWRYLHAAAPYAGTTPWRLLDGALRQAARVRGNTNASGIGLRAAWFRERGVDLDAAPPSERAPGMRAMIRGQVRARLPSALAWEGRNADAAGIEVRFPYLVASMLRFYAALPDEQLVTDLGETRPVLRLALRGLVPDAILDRPHPVGFAVPALAWLRSNPEWVDGKVRGLVELPFCDPEAMRQLREQVRGDDPRAWIAAFALWRWISLQEWCSVHGVAFD